MSDAPMKKIIRSQILTIVVVTVALVLAACSQSAEKMIVGRWKSATDGEVVTFTKDGKVLNEKDPKDSGEYTLSSSNTLTLKSKDLPMPMEMAVAFPTPDEMTLTPQLPAGMTMPPGMPPIQPIKMTRVK
jgi:hypothetical protein